MGVTTSPAQAERMARARRDEMVRAMRNDLAALLRRMPDGAIAREIVERPVERCYALLGEVRK